MTAYFFHVSVGLRGGYMPNESYVVAVKSRKELREIVVDESSMLGSWDNPIKDRDIGTFCAEIWRKRNDLRWYLPFALPFLDKDCEAIFVGPATRDEYRESLAADDAWIAE